MNRNKAWIGIVVVFLLGVLLRFLDLGQQGLFLDEAWSWATAQLPPAQILQSSLRDPHPPLYYLLLKGFLAVLPDTEAGLRTLSALCSAATLAVTLAFVARQWDVRAAIYAGWFIALSTFDLYYAQETRMYTLLGLLWLVSYILLIKAIESQSRLFLGWALTNVLLGWTHFYGLLAVTVQVTIAVGFWGWNRWRARSGPLPWKWLGIALALTILGILPVMLPLWLFRSGGAGGAWIPQAQDLSTLFALSSAGLAAARSRFLDSSHLVLPALTPLSAGAWSALGILTSGGFATWGLWQGLKNEKEHRWTASAALALMFVPVAIAFCYALLSRRPIWALKPFLGAAYLYYLWSGIGLSRIPWAWFRRCAALLALIVSLASLVPYFTTWQKTDAATAFRSLPATKYPRAVLLERAYRAPVAFYYLGPDGLIWGLGGSKEEGFELRRISPNGVQPEDFEPIDCGSEHIQRITDIWVYGPIQRIQQEREYWPACVLAKNLWLFLDDQWTLLDRQP